MAEAIGVDFSGEDVGPTPFSAMRPLPMGHPLTEIISAPQSSFGGGVGVDGRSSDGDTKCIGASVRSPFDGGFGPCAPCRAASNGSWRRQRSPPRRG